MATSFHRQEYLRQKRNKKLFRYGLFFLTFALIVSFVSYISHRPQIRISKVELSGGILVKEDDVSEKTKEFLSGSYFWLFPKNNSLLYPRGGLQNYLKETFKRIDTINTSLKDLNTLVVSIMERKPIAMWCGNDISQKYQNTMEDGLQEQCYFLDSDGMIFAEAPQFSGNAYFKYYGLVATDTPIVDNYYISSSTEFRELTQFVENAKQLSLKPLYIEGNGDGQFIMTLSDGGEIYFDMKEPLSKTSQNLEALLKTDILAKNISRIDYIDLRYGNKLFYKLK